MTVRVNQDQGQERKEPNHEAPRAAIVLLGGRGASSSSHGDVDCPHLSCSKIRPRLAFWEKTTAGRSPS